MVKLPPLPPLPKTRKPGHRNPRQRGSSSQDGPVQVWELSMSVCVQPAEGQEIVPGRWFRTTSKTDLIGGQCGQCERLVRALDLGWKIPPFQTEENGFWACRDCRNDVSLKIRGTVKRDFSKPESQQATTIGGIEAMKSMMNDLIARNLPRLQYRWHPPLRASLMPDPVMLGSAFATAAHIANVITKEKR